MAEASACRERTRFESRDVRHRQRRLQCRCQAAALRRVRNLVGQVVEVGRVSAHVVHLHQRAQAKVETIEPAALRGVHAQSGALHNMGHSIIWPCEVHTCTEERHRSGESERDRQTQTLAPTHAAPDVCVCYTGRRDVCVCVYERERERLCVCVCLCEREREIRRRS
eukprot:6438541-Prymnesium_polylepis.1